MTIQPRDVLLAFKPKLVPKPRKFTDTQWASKIVALRKAIDECEDFAAATICEDADRIAELTTILEQSGTQAQNRRIAILGASAGMVFDELYGHDPNYTP